MKFSIIVGTYNHLNDCLKPCIESIFKYSNPEEKEIIIVANGCRDGTKEYVETIQKNYPEWDIVLDYHSEPLGFSGAYNKGIQLVKGEKIILLNNDTVLLAQHKDEWIDILSRPFSDPLVGLTGPLASFSPPANNWFLIFFCVMIDRKLFDRIGLLSEEYNPGGGEDTEFCIEAEKLGYKMVQVPETQTFLGVDVIVGGFPIYHKGEATMSDNPEWQAIFDRNSRILSKKYNPEQYKLSIMNNYERAVFLKDEEILPRETARYEWASRNIKGNKVLEIGCSNGYGTRILGDIDYTGIDYDERIVQEANETYGDENHRFIHADVNTFNFDHYDTIIAFEILEHVDNGKELAQSLKTHCDTLLCSVPYNEVPGTWGEHHKLHELNPDHFPGFEYTFLSEDGKIIEVPDKFDGRNLLLMKWQKES